MGVIDWFKNLILGSKIISTEEARKRFNDAIHYCDVNNDGWLDVGELVKVFKELCRK